MATNLEVIAREKDTIIIRAAFQDEDDQDVTPSSLSYSLTDRDGTVINSLDAVAVTPSNPYDFILTGDDLQILAGEVSQRNAERRLLVSGTYDSNAGAGLSLNASCAFLVENLAAVS